MTEVDRVFQPSRDALRFGKRLRELREAKGLSLRDVQEATQNELSRGAVSRIERGERVASGRTLEALAGALDVVFTITSQGITIAEAKHRVKV